MLNPNVNKRINWEDYFNHPFFNNITNNLPSFNMICSNHSKNYYGYCSDCKCNICELCELFNHNSHNIIPFYQISFNQKEINQINNLSNTINERLDQFINI